MLLDIFIHVLDQTAVNCKELPILIMSYFSLQSSLHGTGNSKAAPSAFLRTLISKFYPGV